MSPYKKLKQKFQRKVRHSEEMFDDDTSLKIKSSVTAIPQHVILDQPQLSNKVALAAGQFWGTEKFVVDDFQKKFPGSIKSASVGFMSPYGQDVSKHPTYQEVSEGNSGNLEILLVELNDAQSHFEDLIRFFFQFHDPTTKFQQGCNRGFQYSSWIFCGDENQVRIAKRVRSELQILIDHEVVFFEKEKVVTCISTIQRFTPAPAAHEQYILKHPQEPCCQRLYFSEWPSTYEIASSIGSMSSMITLISSSDSSSNSSISSCFLDDDEHRKRVQALENLRVSHRRQEVIQSILSNFK